MEILSARLVEIRSSWLSGDLQSHGLSVAEVLHLVLALFEDTDLRQEVVRDIRAARNH